MELGAFTANDRKFWCCDRCKKRIPAGKAKWVRTGKTDPVLDLPLVTMLCRRCAKSVKEVEGGE